MGLSPHTGQQVVEPAAYPPEPWHLHGHCLVGVWLLPAGVAPTPKAPGTRTIRILGRVLVGAAFFVYTEPSPLTYGEVMSTVLVRDGLVPRVSITHIWVDSPASLAGGRALWAIPKDLATFVMAGPDHYVADGIGSADVRRVRLLPRRLPVSFTTAQDRSGTLVAAPVSGRARLGVATARWSFDPTGPLGFLSGRPPWLSLVLRPFALRFGRS